MNIVLSLLWWNPSKKKRLQFKSKPKYGLETQVTTEKHMEVKKWGKLAECFQFYKTFCDGPPISQMKAKKITMMMISTVNFQPSLNDKDQVKEYRRKVPSSNCLECNSSIINWIVKGVCIGFSIDIHLLTMIPWYSRYITWTMDRGFTYKSEVSDPMQHNTLPILKNPGIIVSKPFLKWLSIQNSKFLIN